MAAQRRYLPLQRPLLLLLLIITTLYTSSSLTPSTASAKVTLELYYETLCPYCANLIVNYLYKIFDTGIIDITDLKLIPYGNAKIRPPNSTIVCQHGPDECLLNTIEACAIDVWPDVDEHFPFVYCVESLIYKGKRTEWGTCFEKLSLDPKPVTDCYVNGRGRELEFRYAAQTNGLQPPHKYVPWVVVDGQPLYDEYRDFLSYICDAYKGASVPPACSEYSAAQLKTKGHVNIWNPACYSGMTIKSILSSIRSAVAAWRQGVTEAAL